MRNNKILILIVFILSILNSFSQRDLEKSLEHFSNGMKINTDKNKPEINNKAIEEFTLALKYDSLCYKCYLMRAVIYEYIGEFELAILDAKKSIDLNTNPNYIYYSSRADIERKLKQYESAIEDYTIAIKLKPNRVESYKDRATCYRELGLFKQAIDDYDIALILKPKDVSFLEKRVICYEKINNFDEAFSDLDKLIKINPSEGGYNYHKAELYIDLHQYRDVIENINIYLKKTDIIQNSYGLRGIAYFNTNIFDSALVDLDRFIKDNPKRNNILQEEYRALSLINLGQVEEGKKYLIDIEARLNKYDTLVVKEDYKLHLANINYFLGVCDYKLNDFTEANKKMKKAEKLNQSDLPNFYSDYAKIKIALKDTSSAIEMIDKCILTNPSDEFNYRLYRITLLEYSVKKYYKKIKADINRMIEISSKDTMQLAQCYQSLAILEQQNNNEELALQGIEKAISLRPNYYFFNYIKCLILLKFQTNKAMPYIEEYITKYPTVLNFRFAKVQYLENHSEYLKALVEVDKMLEIDTTYFSHTIKGIIYYRLNNFDKSCEEMNKAIKLGYDMSKYQLNAFCTGSFGEDEKETIMDKLKYIGSKVSLGRTIDNW